MLPARYDDDDDDDIYFNPQFEDFLCYLNEPNFIFAFYLFLHVIFIIYHSTEKVSPTLKYCDFYNISFN